MKVHYLGLKPYLAIWEQMKQFTAQRNERTEDQIWILEHPAVYTQGQAGKTEHIIKFNQIPVVKSDRGGQVTYHGPGQLIIYFLMDINRRQLGVRNLVSQLEQLIITFLANYQIIAATKPGAPGVYVAENKIASIGLRIKNGCTYHGMSLNVAMNLSPFNDINPCGFSGLKMTQMSDYKPDIQLDEVAPLLVNMILKQFKN